MSFSRNIFDEESYKQIINQSVGPGLYSYNVPKHSCDPLLQRPPHKNAKTRCLAS